MIDFTEALALDKKTARKIESWAVRALVRAAMDESVARRDKRRIRASSTT